MNKHCRNIEGYSDKTAGVASKKVDDERAEVGRLMYLIRSIADMAGYDILGRIVLENKKTGAIYK